MGYLLGNIQHLEEKTTVKQNPLDRKNTGHSTITKDKEIQKEIQKHRRNKKAKTKKGFAI